jgi:hypothetical protein
MSFRFGTDPYRARVRLAAQRRQISARSPVGRFVESESLSRDQPNDHPGKSGDKNIASEYSGARERRRGRAS